MSAECRWYGCVLPTGHEGRCVNRYGEVLMGSAEREAIAKADRRDRALTAIFLRSLALLTLAALLAGCCSLRHAGDPCTVCIHGHPHHVCDAKERP